MKRPALLFCILVLIFLGCLFHTMAASDSIIVPQEADISVNGLSLEDSVSMETILGKELKLIENDYGFSSFYVTNKNKNQILTLVFHPGSMLNQVSEFEVRYLKKDFKKPVKQLSSVVTFESGKKIRLGMDEKKVMDILGDRFVRAIKSNSIILKYHLNNYSESKFLQHFNLPEYYGEYEFQNNRLIRFSFGFSYP